MGYNSGVQVGDFALKDVFRFYEEWLSFSFHVLEYSSTLFYPSSLVCKNYLLLLRRLKMMMRGGFLEEV